MARKKRDDEGGSTWLDTYADMVTLLLTFFVVLLSMSSIEVEKFDALIRSFTPNADQILQQMTVPSNSDEILLDPVETLSMESLYEQIKQHVEENELEESISVKKEDEIVFIQFNSNLLFEPDRYVLLPGAADLLDFVGETLKLYEGKIKNINVCGHTAQTDRVQSEISDWRLSGERAATVAMYFEERCEVSKFKMMTFGYGDNYPIADNATEPGRRQNRRVELVVVGMDSLQNFDVYGVLGGVFDNEQYPSSGGADTIFTPGTAGGAGAAGDGAAAP